MDGQNGGCGRSEENKLTGKEVIADPIWKYYFKLIIIFKYWLEY